MTVNIKRRRPMVSVTLSKDSIRLLGELAKRYSVTKSEVVEQAIFDMAEGKGLAEKRILDGFQRGPAHQRISLMRFGKIT